MDTAKKLSIANLAEFRAASGLTQEQFSNRIKPMTRQTIASLESKDAKDAEFVLGALRRMKDAFGAQFPDFDWGEDEGLASVIRIRYAKPQPYQISDLVKLARDSMEDDWAFIHVNDSELRDLKRTLLQIFGIEQPEIDEFFVGKKEAKDSA